jgi:hypothetical protein
VSQDEWPLLGGALGTSQMNEHMDCLLAELTMDPTKPAPGTECIQLRQQDPPGQENSSLVELATCSQPSDELVGHGDCGQCSNPLASQDGQLAHTGFLVISGIQKAPRCPGTCTLEPTTFCHASNPRNMACRIQMQTTQCCEEPKIR